MKPELRSRRPSQRASEGAAAAQEKNEPAPRNAPKKSPKSPKRFLVTLSVPKKLEAIKEVSEEDHDSDVTEPTSEGRGNIPITKVTLRHGSMRGVMQAKSIKPSIKIVKRKSTASSTTKIKISRRKSGASTPPKTALSGENSHFAKSFNYAETASLLMQLKHGDKSEAPQETSPRPLEEGSGCQHCDRILTHLTQAIKNGIFQFSQFSREPMVRTPHEIVFCNERFMRISEDVMNHRLTGRPQEEVDRWESVYCVAKIYVDLCSDAKEIIWNKYWEYQETLEAAHTLASLRDTK